jgi:transcriptional regulator with XRE-family HTH domain
VEPSDNYSIAPTKSSAFITHALCSFRHLRHVRRNLEKQLAAFLRKRRGTISYAKFAKVIGLSHTTLHRLERGEHHLTLYKLETVIEKLRIRLKDIFPDEF